MKLGKHAFQTFFDLHTWTGVAATLFLYVMFFMGAFALFTEDLALWQAMPRRPAAATTGSPAPSAAAPSPGQMLAPFVADPKVGDRQLRIRGLKHGPPAVGFYPVGSDDWQSIPLDARSGQRLNPRSELGQFLFQLHYLWHDDAVWLYYLAGFASVALLLAIVTGVLIHLKDIVGQIDQFRPAAKARVMFTDLHKVLGVFGLPFQILFAFTGALLVLTPWMAGTFVGPVLKSEGEMTHALGWGSARDAAPGPPANRPPPDVDALLARARQIVPAAVPTDISLYNRGRQGGVARVRYDQEGTFYGRGQVTLALADGRLLDRQEAGTASETPAAKALRWLYGVHFAAFGGQGLRFLFALMSLATALTIITGNWIWLGRRERKRARFGNRLLARLTLAVGGGVVVATAAIFWANRLLPDGMVERIAWERKVFFITWAVVATWSLAREATAASWVGQLAISGLGFTLIPLAGALGAGRQGGQWRVGADARALLVTELTLALLGLALLVTAWAIQRHRRRATPAKVANAEVRRVDSARPSMAALGRSSVLAERGTVLRNEGGGG